GPQSPTTAECSLDLIRNEDDTVFTANPFDALIIRGLEHHMAANGLNGLDDESSYSVPFGRCIQVIERFAPSNPGARRYAVRISRKDLPITAQAQTLRYEIPERRHPTQGHGTYGLPMIGPRQRDNAIPSRQHHGDLDRRLVGLTSARANVRLGARE